jgi:hypothetical protein
MARLFETNCLGRFKRVLTNPLEIRPSTHHLLGKLCHREKLVTCGVPRGLSDLATCYTQFDFKWSMLKRVHHVHITSNIPQ